jgi:CheY-like chemotaxis protein
MGGRIDFTSEEGRGSSFRMSLSTTVPQNIEPNSARHRQQLAERKAKALLLVSTERQRRSLALLLKAWGLDVEIAESLEELETKLPSATAEAVVSIVEHRPERVDLEALRRLRRPPRREVVLLTSLGVSTSTVLSEICPYVVLKPVRQERLAAALVRALGLRPRESAAPVAAPAPIPAPLARHRILLVEDNPDNQKLAARVLEGAGAQVDTAENGKEAVRMASATLYDLVVMDVMMPVMDGFTATREIRRRESPANRVPVVALTAHATEGFRDRCLECGMDDYLSKPFKRDRFLALVDQWGDRRPIVLVVDDAAENRLIVKRFLMLGGDYRLLFAANGEEALEVFERQDVSLVLLDVEMPVMNGLETLGRLRSPSSRDPGVPVLAMTAHSDEDELDRCLSAGASAVLQKPLDRKTLGIAVAKHLRPRSPMGFSPLEEDEEDAGLQADGVVRVDPDILDLVPRFVENQKAAATRVIELAVSGDFDAVRRIGHNMKGTGKGYGFDVVSACGASLEQAAVRGAREDVERIAGELDSYLTQVRWQPRR